MEKVTYYSGTEEVKSVWTISEEKFRATFPGQAAKRSGSGFLIGNSASGDKVPVTRIITFKSNPKLHKCDDKCRNAKGSSCECECEGKFHGLDYPDQP